MQHKIVPKKGGVEWGARQGHKSGRLIEGQFLFEEVYLK